MLIQWFFWGVPIIALASYAFLLILFSVSKKDKVTWSFIPFILSLAVWTASSLFMKLQLYPSVLFWNEFMIAGMLTAIILFYIFFSIFTKTLKWYKVLICGAIDTVFIYLSFTAQIVKEAKMVTNTQTVEFEYKLGNAAFPIYIFSFLFLLFIWLSAMSISKRGIVSASRIKPIVIGNFIIFAGILSNITPQLGKYPIDILAGFVYAILILVAIYKKRFIEFRFMFTKGMIFSFIYAVSIGMYLYISTNAESYIKKSFNVDTTYITPIIALIVAVIFQQVFLYLYKYIDKVFNKKSIFRRQALKNFNITMVNNLNLEEITEQLIMVIQNAVYPKNSYIMILDEDKKNYSVCRSSTQLTSSRIKFTADNPIVKWLADNNECLTKEMFNVNPYFKSVWDSERRIIEDMKIELIVPVKCRNGLIGMMLLSEKGKEASYMPDEMDLLASLGATAGVAFDNARLYRRAQSDALVDDLTKLYNHRYFSAELAKQVKAVKDFPLSLLMLDLDMFKLYNDLYGHLEGDKALAKFGAIMKRIVGGKGTVSRYGGEEFSIILPYLDAKKSFDIAEMIRCELQSSFINNKEMQSFLTVSIGLCTYPYEAPNLEELLKRTDFSLYYAKHNGKNQTVIYTSELHKPTETSMASDTDKSNSSYAGTVYALTAAIDVKDHYTFGHCQKVTEYSVALAAAMNLDNAQIDILKEAATLHDIGKIGIPEYILTKPGKLTNEEYNIMKKHVEMSIEIVKHLPLPHHVIPIITSHHERWDGKGYPRGISGESIPVAARCLAIADAFEAMTADRPYRKAMAVNEALAEVEANMGTQFDPNIARVFINIVRSGELKIQQEHTTVNTNVIAV